MDQIIEQWHRERPDLDPSGKEITGRIVRLRALFADVQEDYFGFLGINESEYGILSPLRRAGPPYELTPTELARTRMISSGGMTAAIDRVERKGLVTRLPNPADRRGSLVRLTEEGLRVINAAMEQHTAAEQSFVSGLSVDDRQLLASLLRKLLMSVDAS